MSTPWLMSDWITTSAPFTSCVGVRGFSAVATDGTSRLEGNNDWEGIAAKRFRLRGGGLACNRGAARVVGQPKSPFAPRKYVLSRSERRQSGGLSRFPRHFGL